MQPIVPRRMRMIKKRRRKWLLGTVSIVLISILGIIGYYGLHVIDALKDSYKELGKSNLRTDQVQIQKHPFTILLSGIDQREKDSHNWRPDVLMLITVNPKKSIRLVSVPRDTRVPISNSGGAIDKINAAAAYGYRNQVDPDDNIIQTVEKMLNIPVDYYVRLNFQGFTDIVNLLGGVDVNPKMAFSEKMIGGRLAHFKPGPTHLNGDQTLAYVRMRKHDPLGDGGRNERQREVIIQLMNKIVSMNGISKIPEITNILGNNLKHSFKKTEILPLCEIYKSSRNHIEGFRITTYGKIISGIWYEILTNKERIRVSKFIQKELEFTPNDKMEPSDAYPL